MAFVGNTKPTIKPDDLVRTRDGRTATVVEIRPGGFRWLVDVASNRPFEAHVDDLYLVRSALPRAWPSHLPGSRR